MPDIIKRLEQAAYHATRGENLANIQLVCTDAAEFLKNVFRANKPAQRLVIPTTVLAVEERTESRYLRGFGGAAEFEQVSIGWFVTLNEHLTIGVGPDKPPLAKGDAVRLIIEKT